MLYIVRHGQTKMNAQNLMNGIFDDKLNEQGVMMALETGEKLNKVRFDAVFVSPLSRTQETAKCILSKNLYPVSITVDERIIERDFGDLTGKEMDFSQADRWRFDFPADKHNMESLDDMIARTKDFIEFIKREYKGKSVLVVTHNGALRGMRIALGDEYNREDIIGLGIDNASVLRYEL